MKLPKSLLIQPRSLIFIFIATAAIITASVLIELSESKKEMIELMETQSHSLLETILVSSQNALLSYEKIEAQLKERLLIVAVDVRTLYDRGIVTQRLLDEISKRDRINRINIFNSGGEKKLSSIIEVHENLPEKSSPLNYLSPLLNGEADTLFIGLKPARFEEGFRFAVGIRSANGDVIVVSIDAAELVNFRKEVGFGVLLKNMTENNHIEYAALQNEFGIIAASGKVNNLEQFSDSEFLTENFDKQTYKWRIIDTDSVHVFEAVHPLVHDKEIVGIFRLGLSLEPITNLNERIARRIIFLGLVFLVLGFITLTLVFVRQNFDLLSKKVKAVEDYASRIINNTSDSIFIIDNGNRIISLNNSAQKLLDTGIENAIGKDFLSLIDSGECGKVVNSEKDLEEFTCSIGGREKVFLISKSIFNDEQNRLNKIIIMRDLTELKILEDQIQRNDRLKAMGELASSVAHEIRNPLNSIGTITQQLGKDFIPDQNREEFKSLTALVYKEVKRINGIIENFLNFARPRPIKVQKFTLMELIFQIEQLYKQTALAKNISFRVQNNYDDEVEWDFDQIKQILINLIENAMEAVSEKGSILISFNKNPDKTIEITVEDTGRGISKDDLKKIFNLYFTTKSGGNGIGLSIVQKIVTEHNGSIFAESTAGRGTKFTINLPINFKNQL